MFGPPYILKEFKKGSHRRPIPFKEYIKWRKLMYKVYFRAEEVVKNINWE